MDIAYRKLLKARTGLLLEHPFFGSLCLRMEPTPDTSCDTAWTNGKIFGYNPGYVSGLTDEQAEGLVAHTVMHPACQHHVRRHGRDNALWNMACDHSINWILLDAGISLPPKYLDNEKFHGLTADEIYIRLKSLHGEEDKPALSDQQGETDGDASWDGLAGDAGEGEGLGDNGDGGTSSGDDGAADGVSGDDPGTHGSDQNGDPGGSGEVRDGAIEQQGGGAEDGGSDEQWELALAQAAQQARDSGDLPGSLERLVGQVLSPKLDWREMLDRYISDRARDDYSWGVPNKRYLHMDVILPSLSHRKLPEVVLAIDTSGSISEPELDQFAAEVSGILEAYDTTIHVVYCDSSVTGSETFGRHDLPLDLTPEGGGGTDYRPVFRWVGSENIDPACLVYLTDMECQNYPEYEPDYPVLWARIGTGDAAPPFGDVLPLA